MQITQSEQLPYRRLLPKQLTALCHLLLSTILILSTLGCGEKLDRILTLNSFERPQEHANDPIYTELLTIYFASENTSLDFNTSVPPDKLHTIFVMTDNWADANTLIKDNVATEDLTTAVYCTYEIQVIEEAEPYIEGYRKRNIIPDYLWPLLSTHTRSTLYTWSIQSRK